MEKNPLRTMACVLSAAVMAGSIAPAPVRAELGGGSTAVAEVSYDNPADWRGEVLMVDGKPFWYNGIQIRIDKLADDPNYACDEETMQKLFNKTAADGFTVANSQIRWTDIQPNHTIRAADSSYIYGGANKDTVYDGAGGIHVRYHTDEAKQALGYLTFDVSGMKSGDDTTRGEDGAKIRLCNRETVSNRKIEIYAIKEDWNRSTLTWANAPGRGENYTVNGKLVASTLDYDWIGNAAGSRYYDFDLSEFYRSADWGEYIQPDGTMNFVIRDVTGGSQEALIKLGDFDDTVVNGKDARPQMIYAHADEFDFEYLGKAIDYAKHAGLKFEVLWFGTDTCSLSTDTRVPVWALTYQKTLGNDGKPLYKKTDGITGYYNYNMCKNDEKLRAKEALAIRKTFDYVASRGDDVVIGCQVSNEPGVGLLHGSKEAEHCMCSGCKEKQEQLGVSDKQFREITMWEYNQNLATAVKESAYPVWTRVNLAESCDVEGVAYNEKMRATTGTNLDFIGIDHYRRTPAQLAMEGVPGQQFAQGQNLPMLMELGQKDNRSGGLFLGEDTLACLSGGTYVTIYDASSSDGCEIYNYNKSTKTFTNMGQIDNLVKTNLMLKKIGYDLAIRYPGALGGNHLIYFNPTSASSGKDFRKSEVLGGNKGITYLTEDNGVGIAVNKSEKELALLTAKPGRFSLDNLTALAGIESAELGYYDEDNQWVKEDDFTGLGVEDGKIMVDMPAFGCLRLVLNEDMLGEVTPIVDLQIEAEGTAYQVSEGITTELWDDGASGGKWLKVNAMAAGDSVTLPITVPAAGQYTLDTCVLAANNRGITSVSVNGQLLDETIDQYSANKGFKTHTLSGVPLRAGENELVYTVTGKHAGSNGYVIALDYLRLVRTGDYLDANGLQTLYEEYKDLAQGDYTDESWQKLQEELQKAKALLERSDAGQAEIDQQIILLENAVSGLLIKTDKTKEELEAELGQLIQTAREELNRSDVSHSEAAKQIFTTAIETAENLRGDPAITPAHLVKIISDLQAAIEAFINSGVSGLVLLTDEPFDEAGGNFGFEVDGIVEDGVLKLTNAMSNEATDIKLFDDKITRSPQIILQFEWTPAGVKGKGKSGIEFRDDQGRLLFAIQGELEKKEVRCGVSGSAHDSATTGAVPTVKKIDTLTPGKGYQVELAADFEHQHFSYKITNQAGQVVAEAVEIATDAQNLTKMVACNYWSLSNGGVQFAPVQLVDNFKLYGLDDEVKTIWYTDKIEITRLPEQLKYRIGEMFNGEGLEVTLSEQAADDENETSSRILDEDEYKIEAYDFTAPGEKIITVSYEGTDKDGETTKFTDFFKVTVVDDEESEAEYYTYKIKAEKLVNTVYQVGDEFDQTTIAVTAYQKASASDANPREKALEDDEYEVDYDFSAAGDAVVEILYAEDDAAGDTQEFTTTITVKVIAAEDTFYTTGIQVKSEPDKKRYLVGEELDSTGLRVVANEKASPSNAAREVSLTEGGDYELEYDFSTPGNKTVKVVSEREDRTGEDKTFTTFFKVIVEEEQIEEAVLEAIKVTRKPNKQKYLIGEHFDPEGLEITACYSDQQAKVVNDYTIGEYDFSTAGQKMITITYQECSTTVTVIVETEGEQKPEKVLTGITITCKPDKTTYYTNEYFDSTGMVVEAQYNDGSKAAISGWEVAEKKFTSHGKHQLIVSYEGFEAKLEVAVIRRSGNSGGSSGSGSVSVRRYSHQTATVNELDVSLTGSDKTVAGNWKQDAAGWWYELAAGGYAKNQWAQINNNWYLFNQEGYMLTGWQQVNGVWYYLHESGVMACNTWMMSQNDWYYLGESGAMAVNATTPDGFNVDRSGKWRR